MLFYGGKSSENKTDTSCNRVFFSSCQSLLPRFYTVSEIIINNSKKKKKKEKQTNKKSFIAQNRTELNILK